MGADKGAVEHGFERPTGLFVQHRDLLEAENLTVLPNQERLHRGIAPHVALTVC
jgi:hypothetical protein